MVLKTFTFKKMKTFYLFMSNCILFVIGFLKSFIKLVALEFMLFGLTPIFSIYLGDIIGHYLGDIITKIMALFFLISIAIFTYSKLMFVGLKVESPLTINFLMSLLIALELSFMLLWVLVLFNSLVYMIS